MSDPPNRRWLLFGLAALAGGAALGAGPALGIRRLHPVRPPTGGALHWESYAEVLEGLVQDGAVVWKRAATPPWRGRIERLYATLSVTGPDSTPDAFPDEPSRLAWSINAYNLLVIVAVLRHWPLTGVGTVRGPIEPKPHFGFFFGLRLRLDRRWVHLFGFERGIFAQWPDARVHAAINCASQSCPPLISTPFRAEGVQDQLDAACTGWLREPGVVSFDGATRELVLPPLFGLYPGEFGAAAAAQGWGARDIDWLLHWLPPETAEAWTARLGQGWGLRIPPYDWGISGPPAT